MIDLCYDKGDRQDFDSVESLVQAASNYVRPTDDLRPRTLEAARAACRQRRWNRHVGGLALSVILLALCGVPHWDSGANGKQVAHAAAEIRHFDLNEEAALRTLRAGFDPGWAFFEAFSDLRRKQADLFDGAL